MPSNPYAFEPHRVQSLPGWDGPLPFNMFAGYLNGSDTTRLFYIYVEADEIDPRKAPITAWFNGGPGFVNVCVAHLSPAPSNSP